jgi:hypothetical protein
MISARRRDCLLILPGFSKEEILFAFENFQDFVRYYQAAFIFPGYLSRPLERFCDFLWFHPCVLLYMKPLRILFDLGYRFRARTRELIKKALSKIRFPLLKTNFS